MRRSNAMKQGDNTRAHIVDVSNELFYRQGYGNTSFSDIVRRTGLSKGNITYHFKNKKNILEAIVNKRMEDIKQKLHRWNEELSDPLQRLIRFCEMLVSEQEHLKNYGCPIGTLTGEFSKNAPELYQITLPMFRYFRNWLSKQYSILGASSVDADEKAMELLSRAQGISVLTHVFKDQKFLCREVEKLKDTIQSEYSGNSTLTLP